MIELDIDAKGIESIVRDLAATEQQATKALNTTLNKMAAWVRSKSAKGLSSSLAIQQKIIRRRLKSLRLTRRGNSSQIVVWYGLDPIALIYLQAKQTKAGVKAFGGRTVKSAFIAEGQNGNQQVFKRRGRKRLPIDKQVENISDRAQEYIEDHVFDSAEFEARFFKIFEHELQWQTRTQ